MQRDLTEDVYQSVMDEESLGLNDTENSSVPLLQSMITAYFTIVRQTIQDLVPKVRSNVPISLEAQNGFHVLGYYALPRERNDCNCTNAISGKTVSRKSVFRPVAGR